MWLLIGVCTELRGVTSQETSILAFRIGLKLCRLTHQVLPFEPMCAPHPVSLKEGQDCKRYEEALEPIKTIDVAGDDRCP